MKIIDCQTGSCLKVLNGHRRTPWVVGLCYMVCSYLFILLDKRKEKDSFHFSSDRISCIIYSMKFAKVTVLLL